MESPIIIKNLKLKQDIGKIEMLHIIQYFLFIAAYFIEYFHKIPDRVSIFSILFFTIIYRFYFKTMKNLFYTFWTFSFFIILYLIIRIGVLLPIPHSDTILLLYSLILVLLLSECYYLSSPIYYPRVNWWEYDFRYRADIKIFIEEKSLQHDTSSPNIEGRLSDVRRQACCLAIFEDLDIGSSYKLSLPDNINFEIEIMSKRQYSIGRPKTYGIRFIFGDEDDKNKYKTFESAWNQHKYEKKKMKFIKSTNI